MTESKPADPKEGDSFFRKVARFVANPTTDWAEINSRQDDPEGDLAKAELRAMVERKRRNDFVRKRELDMLRRIRREGLTPEQLAALGSSSSKLEGLKNEVLSNAGETTEHLREDTTIVPDPADRATIEEEHALELRTRDRERKLLKKIVQSIGRLDSGDYGYCDETGEPIGLGRLIARPTATLSLEAQQRRELKQKMFGD